MVEYIIIMSIYTLMQPFGRKIGGFKDFYGGAFILENTNNNIPDAPQGASVPPYQPKDEKKKDPLKIIIPVIAVIAVAVIAVAVALFAGKNRNSEKLYVTDVNGVVVEDADGNPIAVVPESEVIAVTGDNGETYTNAEGQPITTVIYKEVEVIVAATDKSGVKVTDKNGEVVTEKRIVRPAPGVSVKPSSSAAAADSKTSEKPFSGSTTAIPVTDGKGNTGVDASGNLITTVIEITEAPTAIIPPAEISWKNVLGGSAADYFSSVAACPDGAYVTALVTNSKDGDFSELGTENFATPYTVLTKYSEDGNIIWQKALGSDRGINVLTNLKTDSDGNIYASGYGRNVFGLKTRAYYDGYAAKFSKDGELTWAKSFGTSTVDLFNGIALTPDGGVVVVGSVGNNDGDAKKTGGEEFKSRACIVKYSTDGEQLWKNIVGNDKDTFNGVAVTADGSIFAVGNFYSGELMPALGKSDSGVVKFSANGEYIGIAPVSGTGNENFTGITATSDGGIVICGRSDSADIENTDSFFKGDLIARGGYDAFIVKFSGDLVYQFATPFRGQNDDMFEAIVELPNGNFIAAGNTNSSTRDLKGVTTRGGKDIIIASFDKRGDLLWKQSFGGTAEDLANCICTAPDGGYIAAGRTLSNNVDLEGMTSLTATGKSVGVIVKFPKSK